MGRFATVGDDFSKIDGDGESSRDGWTQADLSSPFRERERGPRVDMTGVGVGEDGTTGDDTILSSTWSYFLFDDGGEDVGGGRGVDG